MRYARPNIVRPSRTASSAGGEIDLSEIDVATVLSRLTPRDRERLRLAWAQMTHHEAEAESAEVRGYYAQATEHWGQAAALSEWLETALAEILESSESNVAGVHSAAYPRTPIPPLGEVDFEPPEWVGLTPYEELLELALRVFGASDRGDSQYDLADIRSAAMRGVGPGATPDEIRLALAGDAYELVQLPGGTLWQRGYMAPDDANLPWDSERRTVRHTPRGDEPGDYHDVWFPYTHTDGSPQTHERPALGPLTIYVRGGRPAPAEVTWAHRIGREVRRILGAAGSPLVGQRDITDQRAVEALRDLYESRVAARRRLQKLRENATSRRVGAYAEIEPLRSGAYALTLRHPRHQGQWAKFRVTSGGNLLERAVDAVYGPERAGDADAFFTAAGMSDAEAFRGSTWRNNAQVRRPTAKIEKAVEATRVWLGSVDRVRLRDEERLEARALRAIDAVAAHYGVPRDGIFEQIASEAQRRGLRLARPGQDI